MKKYLKADAIVHIREGDIPLGIQKYQAYLELEPNQNDDDAWASLGGAYRRIGDIDNAILSYQMAYQLNPKSTYALVNLVSLQFVRNSPIDNRNITSNISEAIRRCRETIENGKDSFWTWYDLGTLYLIGGNVDEARKIFYHAVSMTPEAAKENFRSVLNNLNFLQQNNPSLLGVTEIIELLNKYAE